MGYKAEIRRKNIKLEYVKTICKPKYTQQPI